MHTRLARLSSEMDRSPFRIGSGDELRCEAIEGAPIQAASADRDCDRSPSTDLTHR